MRATGIVRRIDDLGRVVIPKEIRRTMRIREGDPLEIFTDAEGEVIFKKYSQVGEIESIANSYTQCLYKSLAMPILITDRDKVISCAGIQKKEAIGRRCTTNLEEAMESRTPFISKGKAQNFSLIEGLEAKACLAFPIISSGDVLGSVLLFEDENKTVPGDAQISLIKFASSLLGKLLEE